VAGGSLGFSIWSLRGGRVCGECVILRNRNDKPKGPVEAQRRPGDGILRGFIPIAQNDRPGACAPLVTLSDRNVPAKGPGFGWVPPARRRPLHVITVFGSKARSPHAEPLAASRNSSDISRPLDPNRESLQPPLKARPPCADVAIARTGSRL